MVQFVQAYNVTSFSFKTLFFTLNSTLTDVYQVDQSHSCSSEPLPKTRLAIQQTIQLLKVEDENSRYWPQKHVQSGNIHSMILDVYVEWQSAQNFLFLLILRKLDKNITLSPYLPLKLIKTFNSLSTFLILVEQDWDRASFQIGVSDLILLIREGRLRHASCPAHLNFGIV